MNDSSPDDVGDGGEDNVGDDDDGGDNDDGGDDDEDLELKRR